MKRRQIIIFFIVALICLLFVFRDEYYASLVSKHSEITYGRIIEIQGREVGLPDDWFITNVSVSPYALVIHNIEYDISLYYRPYKDSNTAFNEVTRFIDSKLPEGVAPTGHVRLDKRVVNGVQVASFTYPKDQLKDISVEYIVNRNIHLSAEGIGRETSDIALAEFILFLVNEIK